MGSMVIRVNKEDTAFLYALLEGYEYYTHYTTLDGEPGFGYRDIQLSPGRGLVDEFEKILHDLPLNFRIIDQATKGA